MLKAIFSLLFATLLMLLLTTWIYRKVRGGRDDGPVQLPPAAPAFEPPQTPIQMRLSADQAGSSLSWAVGLLVGAWWLFTGDAADWLRLLAWLAGLLALLFAAWALWDSWNEQGTRVVADPQGLQLHTRGATRTLPWSRVARVSLLESWASNNPNERGPKRLRSSVLLLQAADGAELLRLCWPLRPAAASAVFLASLPVWTGRAVEVEQQGR